ncbi:uncharacterized protein LOC110627373 [Manihot esculenta]|uniref:Uncharacterized protein n=6 Tax=Manihot esculenta TaxID=3983 RepID=A0ACB7GMJ7_MANES|nr:uncharacterized protein LOC110627373 [Manihot esculenta]KAG8641565.1 hypothetical protein MANES_12G003900v8 [Manihot esculenta]KAG8641566.1 hypothetical protein MANES_12G003900v8 [Manihot esculenta]KAG8641567.1 hypothetical protein MANES_12G003900v8 [Manihot esculenta]KAG8641568.1 hypothetical protein MANES_12G003900v8 [Manihot esculenta]KAG8641569.1 hypothetical protein MANES_12G003900v8 [Manihot esculenta]
MGPFPKSLAFLQVPALSIRFLLFLTTLFPFTASFQPSIYDHLSQNGLPIGLLPKGITDFLVEPTTGHFQINLTQPCNAQFENQLHYDFNISGLLSFAKIGELSGVSQQELFLWFPVKGIRVDVPSSGLIYFDVGVVDKQFSLSLFENPIECTAVDPNDGPLAFRGSEDSKNQSRKLQFEMAQGDLTATS